MRRILLVDHPHFTSATYFLWHGLKEIEAFYPDRLSVHSYPEIPTNYDADEFDLRFLGWFNWLDGLVEDAKRGAARLPQGIPPFHPDERLTALGETRVVHGAPGRKFPRANVLADEDAAVGEFEGPGFDLVLLGNSHRVPTILLARLKERMGGLPPVVYLDGGERDELNEHWVHVFRPRLVFKQILTPDVLARGLTVPIPSYRLLMYPLPLSSPLAGREDACVDGLPVSWLRGQSAEPRKKTLDVFYWMGNTWPAREAVLRSLDALVARRDLPRLKRCSIAGYHFALATSRMAVTMRGSGRDTTRYWEIPLYRTAMVADGTMGCIHPYPFEDRKTAFFYRSAEELVEVVDGRLSPGGEAGSEVERVAVAGQEHLARYHSTAARAMFFLDVLHSEFGFADRGLMEAMSEWKAAHGWDGRPWEGPVV